MFSSHKTQIFVYGKPPHSSSPPPAAPFHRRLFSTAGSTLLSVFPSNILTDDLIFSGKNCCQAELMKRMFYCPAIVMKYTNFCSRVSASVYRSVRVCEGSLATACTAMSSAKETEEESSMDLDLEFTLHLENEKSKTLVPKSKVDLELSLPMGCSESEITSSHQNGIIGGTHFLDDEEPEVLPAFLLPMVVAGGATNLAVIKELKAVLPSARPMAAAGGVNSSAA
ncbi:hypothetical protein Nepgr_030694 [Nepenthes gracilis]|uniref:Uncharacterized protein n=1 Tax=Nepenthes gracilis TaxID=150966 RepID=A0AAD3TH42_NEPGR|nr:hypothetical protein Nepgr_030694 [Nepenthes gracilis]